MRNKKNTILRKNQQIISLLLIVGLVFSSASAGILNYFSQDSLLSSLTFKFQHFVSIDIIDNKTNKMSTDGIPLSSEYSYIIPLLNFQTGNGDTKFKYSYGSLIKKDCNNYKKTDKSSALTSSPLISSQLGKLFTLVGAKPSGTS